MESRKLTNVLLLVLAACLALLAVGLYGSGMVATAAEAQMESSSNVVMGCFYDSGRCVPTPIQVDEHGVVLIKTKP